MQSSQGRIFLQAMGRSPSEVRRTSSSRARVESIPAHSGEPQFWSNCCRITRRNVTDPYFDREQTKAKHFILRRYLQALAFKVLKFFDITYVDGFSGPWKTTTENFADSSFMIAIDALKDAQQKILTQTGI